MFETFKPVNIVFLRRINIVQQAISLWNAELTQSWTSKMEKIRDPHYNFDEIKRRYYDLKIQNFAWLAILKKERISFLNVYYEDLLINKEKFFFNLLCYIGRGDIMKNLKFADTKIQRNNKTNEWEERFRAAYKKSDQQTNQLLWTDRSKYWTAEENIPKNPDYWEQFI